jgi:type IV pilus assembly protein PilY1
MASQIALAGPTDVSNVPLATSGGRSILPNLLIDLDDSGSMAWTFMPDYVSPDTGGSALTQSVPCMLDSNKNSGTAGKTFCHPGDPPYAGGGAHAFNGVGYDPNFRYLPGVNSNGQPLLNPPTGLPLGNPVTTTVVADDVYSHSPFGSSTTTVDLSSGIPDMNYCNANGVCKRPGATTTGALIPAAGAVFPANSSFDSASSAGNTMTFGQFPYRTNPSNASTAIFGLPEMMSIGNIVRVAGGTTTATVTTVEAHGLSNTDRVFITSGTANLNVTCAAISVTNANTFTYTSGGTGSATTAGSYRKCLQGSWSRSSSTVTVSTTPNAPGLQVGDVITVAPASSFSTGAFNVTAVGATSFSYTSATGTGPVSGFWVRTGLYNQGTQVNGAAVAYATTPVEFCSDPNLTNCVYVLPGNTPAAGFTNPAYVRFCQTQAQALAPGAVSDSSGTPQCRSKYNETSGITNYTFARYGWFKRDTIVSSPVAPFNNRPNRTDCAAPPACTYAEEINNYAIWYSQYRARLQMMKSAVGIAFIPFIGSPSSTPPKPNAIRLGFITMHAQDVSGANGNISSTKYLKIQDFDTTQATNFYNTFYKVTAGDVTPLQEALARAGWIFAGKFGSGLTKGLTTADDPVQAACQRNYTLLTTDGFWNNLSSNPPLTPAGKTIGNLDAQPSTLLGSTLVDRPLTVTLDGNGSTSTTLTPSGTTSEQALCQGNNQAVFPTLGGPTNCGCQPKEHKIIEQDVTNGTLTTFSNGVQTGSGPSSNQSYTTIAACQTGNWNEVDTPQTVVQDKACKRGTGGSVAVFADGSTVSCSACGSSKGVLIRQTKTQTQTVITTDSVQTQNNAVAGTTTISYSTDGIIFSTTFPGSCPSNPPASILIANPQTTSGTPVTTSATGTTLAVWSPNPQSVSGGTPTSTFSGAGTASTVADVAMYFYQTKLRGGTDVNNDATGPANGPNTTPPNTVDLSTNSIPVKTGAKDFVTYQHMVTFGIGLADGLTRFQADYATATSGDFFNIQNGTVGACFWTTGSCNWPAPANNTSANLDDLWHAAVNGRGSFFQALNADALRTGIATVLTSVNAQVASASASATSSPNVTQTDNQIFSTTYETNTWSGSVFAQTIDPVTGIVNPTIQWQADQLLINKVSDSSDTRNILMFDVGNTGAKIKQFTFTNLNSQEQDFFSNKCGASPPPPAATLSQCTGAGAFAVNTAPWTAANDGNQMVNYLRGQQSNETAGVFRDRELIDPITGAVTNTVLGDTITAKPVFVRNPILSYADAVTPSYATFAAANANRAPRVYVAANDGMLHAFDGSTGVESWAYVPRFIMPGLYALADIGYSGKHQFFVDGSPETFDVFDTNAGAWKTILIGGAGGGGRGFYALDISDPANPLGLWEFCNDSTLCSINDADLGFSWGNPVVGKRSSDGRWVAVVTSGLNNIPTTPFGTTGTGTGFFYVLDAITGQILSKVSTGVGTVATPAGLLKMSAFYNSALTDATMQFVYGGDQLGNLWRLDLGSTTGVCNAPAIGSAPCVTHMATLTDGGSPTRTQPITTRPSLTTINNNRVLYVGTGRYLGDGLHSGPSDLSDPGTASGIAWLQTLYAIKDKNVNYGILRSSASLVVQTLTLSGASDRNVTKNPVDWNVNDGFVVDFAALADDPAGGERVNIDPRLVLGTVVVVTNTPAAGGTCSVGGTSRQYNFDYLTGGYIGNTQTPVGLSLGGTIAVGMAIVQLPSSALKDIITGADTSKSTVNVTPNSGVSSLKRFSYRER